MLIDNNLSTHIIKDGNLYKGGCFFEDKTIIIGYGDLTYKRKTDNAAHFKKNKNAVFFEAKVGEAVVHDVHGVGICQGLERRNFNGVEKDFCIITYEGGDKLYVAVEAMNRLNAYAGSEDTIKLNKIGGADFARQKEKVKKSIKEFSLDLKALYAKRENAKGHRYDPSNALIREFEQDFPFDETSCQLLAIEEGLNDLIQGKIMDRLLCGDVGYGKTEVAMRLMYKVVLENKQAAFISPTTILAKQHFNSLKKRMEKHGVSIGSLTRFDSPSDIKKTIGGLKNGTIDIVCGTHRILSKDIEFKSLGLLVLDEEQRFGVADKDKIKTLKNDVNVLSLSATPIPRTLHMSMSGIRDISTLDTPPRGRIPISTHVAEYTESLVFDAVTREIGRGGQAFIVYNRVEKIDTFAASVTAILPKIKIAVAHGQMKESILEDTINRFILGEIDVLIASTIIENGIDMPNANTMIIVDADRLGLSQLYQLRGRIGRSDRLAFAFFTFDGSKVLTENAYKRLDAIAGYTDLGAGFKLAMRDLEIRGAGNILGREQSGHMQRVGYDMYLKLIDETMSELGGKVTQNKTEAKINTDFSAIIGSDYIEDIQVRMREYKRIAEIDDEELAASELDRLKEIYGNVPKEVRNLVYVSFIKNLAENKGASAVSLNKQKMSIKFNNKIDIELIKKAVELGFEFNSNDNTLFIKSSQESLRKVMRLLGA
ncbi:MAG: DEAD/DEAH box helicase [Firmicutes bacterium]|nr:DEAD/DEAH box helicase [Bacillota bacterium]